MATIALTPQGWGLRLDLLWRFTLRQLHARYTGSVLGIVWAVLHPLLSLALYTFLFSAIMKIRLAPADNGTDSFPLWLFAGLWPWTFFAESVGSATSSVLGEPQLLKRTLTPAWILPTSRVMSSAVLHGIGLAAFVVVLAVLGQPVSAAGLASLIVPCAGLLMLTTAVAWLVAALTVFLRDLAHAVGTVLQFAFYLTPIIYPQTAVPQPYASWMKWNPMVAVVGGYRDGLFRAHGLALADAVWLLGSSALALAVSIWIFRRLRTLFVDVL